MCLWDAATGFQIISQIFFGQGKEKKMGGYGKNDSKGLFYMKLIQYFDNFIECLSSA